MTFEEQESQRTLGVRLLSSSSAEIPFPALGGGLAAALSFLSFFLSSIARCFCRFFSSVLLEAFSESINWVGRRSHT